MALLNAYPLCEAPSADISQPPDLALASAFNGKDAYIIAAESPGSAVW